MNTHHNARRHGASPGEKLSEKQAQLHYNLGRALAKKGDLDGAIASLQRALEVSPNWSLALQALQDLQGQRQKILEKATLQEATDHYNAGKDLLEKSDYVGAIACFRRAIEVHPGWVDAHLALANTLVQVEEPAEAMAVYQRVLELKADLWEVHHKLGNLYRDLGRQEEAIVAYERSIELRSDFAWNYDKLADVLVELQEWQRAIVCYEKLVELQPDFAWGYYKLGDVCGKLEHWDGAVQAYRLAIKLDEKLPQVYEKLGAVLECQTKLSTKEISEVYRKAIENDPNNLQLYYKALEVNPQDAEISFRLANVLRSQGKLEQAITFYKNTLQFASDKPQIQVDIWQDLGNVFQRLGRLSDAGNAYHQAVKLEPNQVYYHFCLIRVLQQLGKFEDAVKIANQAIQIEPRLTSFYANWGVIKENIGATESVYQIGDRPKVAVCGWELAHNSVGRVYTLAQLYQGIAEVEIIGSIFPDYGRELWEPIRNTSIPCHSFIVEDESLFLEQAMQLVLSHPYDVVHLSKPRMPNILFGLLYKLVWNAQVIVDIDDEELGFVNAEEAIDLDEFLKSQSNLPELNNLTGQQWTQIAVGLAKDFDGITVSNPALQNRYGGEIIRHARNELLFQPSNERRIENRKKFGIANDKKVILFFGTPREHKGLLKVANILARLDRKDVLFAIIGDFTDLNLKNNLQAIKNVEFLFLGSQLFDQIPDVVSIGDICILLQDEGSLVSRFQIPAKLSDALGMGLTILLSNNDAVADVIASGGVFQVSESNLETILYQILSDEVDISVVASKARELFITEFTWAKNRLKLMFVLGYVIAKPVSYEKLPEKFNLFFQQVLGRLRERLEDPEKVIDEELGYVSSILLQQAQSAIQNGDWSESARCWRKLWANYKNCLSPDTLVLMSNGFFKLDAFAEATNILERVLATYPDHAGALMEQKNQYYYHAYSSWLMKTVEGISDWYKVDGLLTPPSWDTVIKLSKSFIKSDVGTNSDSTIRQYVQSNLLLAEEYWERQDSQNAMKTLEEGIKSFAGALPLSLINTIINSINEIRQDKLTFRDELTHNIQKEINNTNIEILSVNEWLLLYDVLNWNGLFEVGWVAREKAIHRAYQQVDAQPNDVTALIMATRASIEQGNLTLANQFINRLVKTNCNSQQLNELIAYKCLHEGNIEGFRSSWPYPAKLVDLGFQEYIRGKSVAIVGPAPTGALDGEEIDSFDVIIRFNYRGEQSMGDAGEYGTKTHISLYNAHTIRYFVAYNQLDILSNLDFCLIRRPRYDLDDLGWDKNKIRLIYETDNIFYKSLNGVPAVLFDVLLQGADKVKLFKTNFYLTTQHHFEKYRGRSETDFADFPLRKIQTVVANHDLISQVIFTQNLWKAGLVHADEQCCTVLNLSEIDYLSSIKNTLIKECRENDKQSVNYAQLQNRLGKSLEKQKKYELALEKYNYAMTCFNLGKRANGITSICQAIALQKSNSLNSKTVEKSSNSLRGIVFISSLQRPLYGMNRSIVQIYPYLEKEQNIILDFVESKNANFLIELYEKLNQCDFLLFNSAASLILLLQFEEISNTLIKLNIPIFIYWHETDWAIEGLKIKYPKYTEFITAFTHPFVFHLTVSDECSNAVAKFMPLSRSRIYKVYNCTNIPDEVFKNNLSAIQPPMVLNIASIQERKGTDLFIETAIKVCKKHSTVKFIWLGKEAGLDNYNHKDGLRKIQEVGFSDRIIFPGFVDNPYEYLKTASLIFLSSRDDPFPLTILEAMSCGKNIITFKVGGAPEAVGEHGIVINPFDTDAVAQAILEYLSKPDSNSINYAIQKRYLERYTPEKFSIRLNSCIREGLQRVNDRLSYQLTEPRNLIKSSYNFVESKKTKECFIIGSGRSLLNLTEEEKKYLNQHPCTLAMNRYLLFYEKIGVLPKAMFAADSHFPSSKIVLQTIDKIQFLGGNITYYLDEFYRKLFVIPPLESVWARKQRDKLFEQHGYVAPLGFDYANMVFFKHQFAVYKGFSWAKTLREPLYWFHTSLLTAINLANIIYPDCDIKLLGVDLQEAESFYHDEIMKKPQMLDKHYRRSIEELKQHPTALASTPDGQTMFDVLQEKIIPHLRKSGIELSSCSSNSKLVIDGICKYTPIMVDFSKEHTSHKYMEELTMSQSSKEEKMPEKNLKQSEKVLSAIIKKFGYNPWPTQPPYQNLTPVGRTVTGLKDVITNLKSTSLELVNSELLIVEIGSELGASSRLFMDEFQNCNLICIDPWVDDYPLPKGWLYLKEFTEKCNGSLWDLFISFNWEYKERIFPYKSYSLQALPEIFQLGLPIDIIYLDGCHTFDGVYHDLVLSMCLFPNAKIIGDDYNFTSKHPKYKGIDFPVKKAIEDFCEYNNKNSQVFGNQWLIS
jgi:tetratricopeptide (TPR) repeat protein